MTVLRGKIDRSIDIPIAFFQREGVFFSGKAAGSVG